MERDCVLCRFFDPDVPLNCTQWGKYVNRDTGLPCFPCERGAVFKPFFKESGPSKEGGYIPKK